MKSTSLFSAVLLGATVASSSILSRDSGPSSSSKEPEDPIILLSKDESFHFELLFTLGNTIFGAGDVNDALAAAKDIKAGNFTNWLETFHTLAEYTKKQAEEQKQAVLARDLNRCIALGGNIYFLAKIGATDGRKAAAGTIRGDLALSNRENLVHGSDSAESAEREIALWFPDL